MALPKVAAFLVERHPPLLPPFMTGALDQGTDLL